MPVIRLVLGAGLLIVAGAPSGLHAQATNTRAQPDGARIYAQTCAACHQASGLGVPGAFPPLAGTDWVTGSEDRLVRVLLHGLTGDIEVEGEPFIGTMPTWGITLSDGDVAAVASYVRRSWGNDAPPVRPETVKRLRDAHATRTTPWTAAELRAASVVRKPPAR